MNPHAGVELYLHSLDRSGQLHAPAVLPTGREFWVLQTKPPGFDLFNPLQRSGRIFVLISQDYAVRKPIARLVQALKLIPFPLKAPLLQTSP